MINGITFSEQLMTSDDFAHFMYTFLNHASGITKGCEVSHEDGIVYVQKGYFMQSGRMVRVVGVEEIPSPEVVSGQLYCKVVFEIDLSKENTEEEFNQGYFVTLTGAAAYPEVSQEDLDDGGTLFQMPWCQYIKTTEGITEFEDIREVIDVASVWGLYEDLTEHTTNKSNPHCVTAAQVGARPDTWMPTASDVGAVPLNITPNTDYNSLNKTGYYELQGNCPNNPYGSGNTNTHFYVEHFHHAYSGYNKQIAYCVTNEDVFQRTQINGTWSNWKPFYTGHNVTCGTEPITAGTWLATDHVYEQYE